MLLLITVTYSLAVAVDESWAPPLVVLVQIVTVWFSLRTSRAARTVRIAANVILAATAVIAVLEVSMGDLDDPSPLIFAASGLLYLIAPTAVIRHLASRRVVDQETFLGAVATYLMIGMFFAFAYRFLELVQAGPFFGTAGERNMDQVLFFSFTTLTTTGYGNLVPGGNPGQSLAVAEMLIGQLFLITAISKIVTVWRPSRWTAQDVASQDRGA